MAAVAAASYLKFSNTSPRIPKSQRPKACITVDTTHDVMGEHLICLFTRSTDLVAGSFETNIVIYSSHGRSFISGWHVSFDNVAWLRP